MITSIVGKRFGYRETVIASPNCTAHKLQSFCQLHGLFPDRMRINRQYLSLMDPTEENIRLINQFQPRCYSELRLLSGNSIFLPGGHS
jgi:hypothetical protein